MYAIVEMGGKQYRIEKGITLNVDKINVDQSDEIAIEKVLMFVDDDDNILIGKPYLSNVKVTASVLGMMKGSKVRGVKFKKRKNYTRTLGYRHDYLQLKINELSMI